MTHLVEGGTMDGQDASKTLLRRVERLERENWRLKVAFSGVLGATLIGLLTAQTLPKSRTVQAERFVIMDAKGNTRGEFGTDSLGLPNLFVGGQGTSAMAGLGVQADGSVTLAL